MASQLESLLATDRPGVDAALQLVTDLDAGLLTGYGRPNPDRDAALAALTSAVAATPLADKVAAATLAIAEGIVTDEQLAVVAAARSALLGAVHDALLSDVDEATDRARVDVAAGEAVEPDKKVAALRGAARAWLTELAITGVAGLDEAFLGDVNPIVEGLGGHPAGRRLAVLLDGLSAELRSCTPIALMAEPPMRRWADLWSRAQLLSRPGHVDEVPDDRISGRLLVLGTELFEHSTLFGVVVHGVVETGKEGVPRLVRATVTAPKVDVITGPAMWNLITDRPNLMTALAEDRCLELTDMPITPTGELVWSDEDAKPGEVVDPLATARLHLVQAVATRTHPLDRHPVAIAEPVFVEQYKVIKGEEPKFNLGGATLDIDVSRLSPAAPLTVKNVAASTACIGVLRWDAGSWTLSPLAVQAPVKRVPTLIHNGQWAAGPTDPKVAKAVERNDSVRVLRERAGRLLRK